MTDKINLSGPQTNDFLTSMIHLTQFPYQNSKLTIFSPPTDKITLELLKPYQNLDPVIRQLKSWHNYKTKPVRADTTILGNKTLLRYFRNFNNTTNNENTDLLEYQLNDSKIPCLPLSMILMAFNISHTQNTKGHSGSEKKHSRTLHKIFISQMHQFG